MLCADSGRHHLTSPVHPSYPLSLAPTHLALSYDNGDDNDMITAIAWLSCHHCHQMLSPSLPAQHSAMAQHTCACCAIHHHSCNLTRHRCPPSLSNDNTSRLTPPPCTPSHPLLPSPALPRATLLPHHHPHPTIPTHHCTSAQHLTHLAGSPTTLEHSRSLTLTLPPHARKRMYTCRQ